MPAALSTILLLLAVHLADVGTDEPDQLLTVREVAALCNVRPGTVYEWVATGKIPHYKLGGTSASSIRFSRADVIAWLKSGRRGPVVTP